MSGTRPIKILRKIDSTHIASKLRKLFCRYGAPDTLVTDNGPQFRMNTVFTSLMKEFGIKHRKVTPYHPEANGEVERFNRNLKKLIQAAIAEHQNWRTALQNFLLAYRTTPHATTGVAPAELMFNRPIKDKLPNAKPPAKKPSDDLICDYDCRKKAIIAKHAEKCTHAKHHTIKIGDSVLIVNTQTHRDKFTPRWKNEPYIVAQTKGNSIFIRDGKNRIIMRTSSHVKPYHQRLPTSGRKREIINDTTESSSDDDFTVTQPVVPTANPNVDEASSDTVPYQESNQSDETVLFDLSDHSDEELFIPESISKGSTRICNRPARFDDYV